MSKFMRLSVVAVIVSGFFGNAFAQASDTPHQTGSNSSWLRHVQQNCPPPDALPPGSYSESCHSCKMEGCGYLTCVCDGRQTGIDTKNCSANQFWNDHGSLRCGNG